jgi:transposase
MVEGASSLPRTALPCWHLVPEDRLDMKAGGEFFVNPATAAQRRYEALRAYLHDDESAETVAESFGYTPATVRQLASELRAGRLQLFAEARPGPKGPRKQPKIRTRVLELRARDLSITQIAKILTDEGMPVSHDTVWQVLQAEGLERLAVRGVGRPPPAGPAPRTPTVKVAPLERWPAGARIDTEHAGLYLLLPALVELGFADAVKAAKYPSTKALSSWHSMAALLACKLARHRRIHHVEDLVNDPAMGLIVGLNTLPKTTHLSGYSHRVERSSNQALLAALAGRLVELDVVTGTQGFNVDFHAIRHHGQDPPLEDNYVPKRSQSTTSVLSFVAQDHDSQEPVYANADVLKTHKAREVLAFVDYWQQLTGQIPSPLVFDSQLTTYDVLDELSARGVSWLTLRKRGRKEIERIQALPAKAWSRVRIDRAGRYRNPHLLDETIELDAISHPVRQIAIANIGRDKPTLAITNDHDTTAKALFTRYAERMLIENELAYLIGGFHLDALSSGLALNVDLDTTLTVAAANTYRLFARQLPRYQRAQPERLHRDFIDAKGTIHVDHDTVTVALKTRTYHPVLLDAGYPTLEVPVPWWDNRRLRFTFPPR